MNDCCHCHGSGTIVYHGGSTGPCDCPAAAMHRFIARQEKCFDDDRAALKEARTSTLSNVLKRLEHLEKEVRSLKKRKRKR